MYRFKGGKPANAKPDAEDGGDAEAEGNVADAKAAANEAQAEGGLYIGEWNAGFMQGLGILKYDDGERYRATQFCMSFLNPALIPCIYESCTSKLIVRPCSDM